MFEPDDQGVYARVNASPGRRVFAVVVLYVLGGLLIWLPLNQPPALAYQVMLLAFGVLALFGADALRRATKLEVLLTRDGLIDSTGRHLVSMDQIKSVERGVFAMKPSNGFLLVTHDKQSRIWAPGLFWRLGRRIGVGGVTSAGQTKFMAEQIALRLAQRD